MRTAGLSTQLAVVTQEEDKMAVAVISETSGGQDDMEETEEPDREKGEEDEGLHYYHYHIMFPFFKSTLL